MGSEPGGEETFESVLHYNHFASPRKLSVEGLATTLADCVGEPGREIVMSMGQRLIEQGIVRGERSVLVRTLRVRCGELSNELLARIEGGSLEQIRRWQDRAFVAERVEDVFRGEPTD